MTPYVERRRHLTALLQERGVEGAFITSLINVRYLTGFTGSNGAFWITADGRSVFLTDGRYKDQAALELPDVDLEITRELVGNSAARMSNGSWAIETHTLSVDQHRRLAEAAPETSFVSLQRAVEGLRVIKDDAEIASLRAACDVSTRALEGLIEGPLLGRSEREIARDLENRMYALGAEAIAFDTILASGPNSAIPHHHPGERVVGAGDLLKIDFGARVDGYHADCTRTFVVGKTADWQREIYEAVKDAQAEGLDQLREGIPVSASLEAVRASLTEAGWLESFTTGLGHGVGLEIHEDPFISASQPGKIEPCTAMTMEPGIYLPGRGGVRIEDTVVVTSGAPEVLTTMTKELLELA
ncbi:MAG: Xaa-Pro peptidase family protein [Aeromicrobium sp.]